MRTSQWIVSIIWLAGVIGALSISRTDFYMLWSFYSIAFAAFAWLVTGKNSIPLVPGLCIAFLCRLASFFFDPLLSDDYFRFIWDGMVMHEGLNPATYTPQEWISQFSPDNDQLSLYASLNSQAYYTVYPPVTQLFFYLSYAVNHLNIDGHILFFKSVLLFLDAGIIYLLGLLLKKNNQPPQRVLLYALNPLIIIEFTGNLHMESLMIIGLLAAIILSYQRNWHTSSMMMALSITAKMFSLMLMPFMPRHMYWKKIIMWGLLTVLLTALLFLLFFGFNYGWIKSIGLWFQSFEFNASMYYLVREIHSFFKGYDHIQLIGPWMAVITLCLIGLIWIFYLLHKAIHWSTAMVMVLTVYFLMSTTVHPWYLGTLFVLSIISGHRYPLVWTYLIFLSYSHYQDGGYSEKYLFILAEYLILFLWIGIEFRRDYLSATDKRKMLIGVNTST